MGRLFILFFIFSLNYFLFSSEGLRDNKYVVGLSYDYSEKTLFFQSMHEDNVLVGTHTVVSKTSAEYQAKMKYNRVRISLNFHPYGEKVSYVIKFGVLPAQSCRFDGSDYNFGSIDSGWSVLAGLQFNIFPETIVNPGVFITAEAEVERYKFNFISDSSKNPVDVEFQTTDILFGLAFEKSIHKMLTLYTAGNIVFRSSDMKDKATFYTLSGTNYTFDFTLSAKINITKNESLVLKFNRSVFTDSTFMTSCMYTIKL